MMSVKEHDDYLESIKDDVLNRLRKKVDAAMKLGESSIVIDLDYNKPFLSTIVKELRDLGWECHWSEHGYTSACIYWEHPKVEQVNSPTKPWWKFW